MVRPAVVAFALTSSVCATSAVAQPGSAPRIAHFSPRAFAASDAGRAAMADLDKRRADAAARASERSAQLETRRQEFTRIEGTLSALARGQQERALARFELDTRRFIEDLQTELFRTQEAAEAAFLLRLRPAVIEVAKTRGLSVILDADAPVVIWTDPALDITADVVARLAAQVGKR